MKHVYAALGVLCADDGPRERSTTAAWPLSIWIRGVSVPSTFISKVAAVLT